MIARARIQAAAQAALLVLAGLWIYFPALRGDWVWDDLAEVAHNPVLADPAGLRAIWIAPQGADYFPLKTTLQWLEWRAWGPDRLGDHLVTLALHLGGALLFWRLLARWGVRWAWLGGLILAIHPLAVESVAWIAETKNTLSLALALLAVHAYLNFEDKRAAGRSRAAGSAYLLAVVLFLAALLSKTTVVMLPALLLLQAWWRRGRITRADLRASAPFFALSLGLGLVTIWFQGHRAMAGAEAGAGGLGSRIAGSGLAVAFYLGKFLWPAGLMPNYPRWNVASPAPAQFLPWVGLGVLAAFCWSRRTEWGKPVLFGLGAFVLSLVPVLGFVPMAYLRISWVADHLAYFPLLGLAGLAAAGAGTLAARPRLFVPVAVLAAAAMLALALVSRNYAGIFRDDETFWSYAVARNPASWLGHNDLGLRRAQAGRLPEAIAQYEEAIRLNPGFAEAHANLGGALAASGQLPPAVSQYGEALRLQPNYVQARIGLAAAHYLLGNTLGNSGRLPEAILQYREAIRLQPDYAEAHANLGLALAGRHQLVDGIAELREALRLRPNYAEAHAYLGFALAQAGQYSEAIGEDEAALRLDPGNADVRYNLENARHALGR